MSENNNQNSDLKYLEKLEFNPDLRKSWLSFFVTNFRVVALIIFLISAWGIYSFSILPRESNPEVKIPIAVVSTVYSGASPADIEELVTKKLETSISSLQGIKKLSSSSANSFSAITVEFEANQDLNDSIRKLRDKVTSVKNDLPTDASESVVNEISFDDTPIWSISITGPYNGFAMREYAETIRDEIEKISGVREVRLSGGDEKEFRVEYDPSKLIFYGVSIDAANQAIKLANLGIPAGNFEGEVYNYAIRSDGRFYDAKSLGELPVSRTAGGSVVALRDIANVSETAIKKTIYSRLSIAGEPSEDAITLSVIKRTGGSIIDTVKQSKEIVDNLLKTFPEGIKYDATSNLAKGIDSDFKQLSHDFLLTLILVGGILFLVVGLKEAFVAALAIPLVFFLTFGVMQMTGITLNFLSLFSLILSLGLLVDDAIVVVSATKQYMKTGKYTPEEAVLLVLNDFKVVLTTTTLTTVWAFMPLLLATGIMGQFIKSIPITVSVTLIGSLLIALMVNHPLAAVLERIRLTRKFFYLIEISLLIVSAILFYTGGVVSFIFAIILVGVMIWMVSWYEKGGKGIMIQNEILSKGEWKSDELIKKKLKDQSSHENDSFAGRLIHGMFHMNRVLPIYEKYLRKIITIKENRRKSVIYIGILFIIAIALPVSGIVRSEFFPAADFETIYISIEGTPGQKLDVTDGVVKKVEERLLKYTDIVNFSTIVGNPGSLPSSHLASIVVSLKDDRSMKSYVLSEKINKEMADIFEAKVSAEAPRGGPPSGAAFEARVSGNDLAMLDKIVHDLEPILASVDGVVSTDISLKETMPEYTFKLDQAKMNEYRLSSAYVGSTLRTAISGTEVTTVLRDNKEIKIIAKFDEKKIPDLISIQNTQILNPLGNAVYLKDIADIELIPSVNAITHVDQKRTVLLSASIGAKTSSNQVVADFTKKVAKEYVMPQGYSIIYGGENEQNTESVMSIIRAMFLAALLIISTLVIQFNSFRKTIIVLVTVPLALIGVFFGMALLNVTLSFPGLIGILALFGIVVKNAIILIDKMNLNIKFGIPFVEAIIDAGKSRLEAITITSISTIFGILPITLSNETWTALGSVVIFGLLLSSFLTLFAVPLLYVMLIKPEEK
jgi:HAE1 family hydrophobic/amphiphilic exporter-1